MSGAPITIHKPDFKAPYLQLASGFSPSLSVEPADSKDEMPPLAYVGPRRAPTDSDDDMPPLEYVGPVCTAGLTLYELTTRTRSIWGQQNAQRHVAAASDREEMSSPRLRPSTSAAAYFHLDFVLKLLPSSY